jgi:hypothetical protein
MKNILAIVEGILPSAEIIISQPLEYMQKLGKITYDIKLVREILPNITSFNFKTYDIVLFLRLCSNQSSCSLLPTVVKFGCKTIYSLDDYFPLLSTDTRVGQVYSSMEPKNNIETFCKNCSAVMTFSDATYNILKPLNQKTFRLNASTDVEFIDSEYSKIIKDNKSGIVTKIGYAASDHHINNFKVAIPAIERILREFGNKVVFECFFKNKPREFRTIPNFISLQPVVGINNFYKTLISRNWDIGIAPLMDSEFNKHKTDNKFREYAVCRIPGIYSDIGTYNSSIEDKKTGVLCKNIDELWYTTLKSLILDQDYRNLIKENSYKFAIENYSIPIVANKYEEIFNSL